MHTVRDTETKPAMNLSLAEPIQFTWVKLLVEANVLTLLI
jgi:hypothetical protein